jgi:transposase
MNMLADSVEVVVGVDTHKHTHTAAVVSTATGAVLGQATAAADPEGYAALLAAARDHHGPRLWAIEGTGGWGAGLTRFLADHGEAVVELDRPGRPARRHGAKSDPIDAVRAAREALARPHLGEPRAAGERAALSVLLAARRSAADGSRVARQQLHALVAAAPEPLRARFRGHGTRAMVDVAARLRTDRRRDVEWQATVEVLRSLARRARDLDAEARRLDERIETIVRAWRPDMLEEFGVGPLVAATVLCAWSHAGRVRSEAAFASLAGVAPIPASSGLVVRHRLNRSGDRQLNRALHTVVLCRLRYDPATRAYAERRRAEGKTDREIKRCLKRYVARQLFKRLEGGPPAP